MFLFKIWIFNFKIWIFNINFETIMSFIIGIFFGIALLCLVYAILVVASLGDKKFIVKTDDDSLTEQEVKDLILEAERCFKDKKLRGKNSRVNHCFKISKDLAYGIAARFYPNSKYPLLELTVDEVISLLGYIQVRIDDLLDRRGLRLLKKLKVSFIKDISTKTTSVLNSKAFNITKDVSKGVGIVKKVLNIVNPVNWVRKTIIDGSLTIILNKLCLVIIAVVGEETYKIYSKKVLNKEPEIESNIDEIINSIGSEIKGNNELEISNNKFLSHYLPINKNNKKYESIFDSSCKMINGGEQ